MILVRSSDESSAIESSRPETRPLGPGQATPTEYSLRFHLCAFNQPRSPPVFQRARNQFLCPKARANCR